MVRLQLGYDLRRAPQSTASHTDLYAAMLDQCEWADRLGFEYVQIGEHHASSDGYASNPITVCAAIAARTTRIFLRPVVLVPLYDLIRLAEELMTVDRISAGRLHPLLAAGYRPEEFEMFDKNLNDRGRALTAGVELLKRAWSGHEFSHQGRLVRITPTPHQRPHPLTYLGGMSSGAAKRAARIGDRFLAGEPGHWATYVAECERLGREPGLRDSGGPGFLHVTEDPERAWHQLAPYLLHNAREYETWMKPTIGRAATMFPPVRDSGDLRRLPSYQVVTPSDCLELARRFEASNRAMVFLPLLGGIPPELAWESLKLFERDVLPHLNVHRLGEQPS
ncbi:LLM class flavin-dependent oxidoreductase [Mycobacterium colombiense]|uniref:Luciferase family protein n=1 Tax=Mycobacterium colombiense CECT 3035 TaxID=1041522 RepID=J4SI38_9MYCO|nr:LLM class flavin-dependent oxidoreductase [Mycobacterium colombiense]EJO89495.1 luciferase family protein [Mycobacterium colombiense CECT 3035]